MQFYNILSKLCPWSCHMRLPNTLLCISLHLWLHCPWRHTPAVSTGSSTDTRFVHWSDCRVPMYTTTQFGPHQEALIDLLVLEGEEEFGRPVMSGGGWCNIVLWGGSNLQDRKFSHVDMWTSYCTKITMFYAMFTFRICRNVWLCNMFNCTSQYLGVLPFIKFWETSVIATFFASNFAKFSLNDTQVYCRKTCICKNLSEYAVTLRFNSHQI